MSAASQRWLTAQTGSDAMPPWALTDYEITRALATTAGEEHAALQAEQKSRRDLRAGLRPTGTDDDN